MNQSLKDIGQIDFQELVPTLLGDLSAIQSVEHASQLLANGLYDYFRDGSGSELVLSRVFHSFEYGALPEGLQQIVMESSDDEPEDEAIILSLLGTYGTEKAWCQRQTSMGHRVIPLTRDSIVKIPMISRLFNQIGFHLGILLGENEVDLKMGGVEKSFGVFHVANALGSPYIPAQDFVAQHDVKSVIGTGVMLPQGDISVYLAFCRVDSDPDMAASISPLMSVFWQTLLPLLDEDLVFFEE